MSFISVPYGLRLQGRGRAGGCPAIGHRKAAQGKRRKGQRGRGRVIKINQLKYFLKIVEAGSLSRAARNLGVAQPALSQHVANLEQALGASLLRRSTRGVVSTPAGDRLYEHARTILRQIERAESDVRHLGQSQSGEVAIVIAASVAQIIAAPLVVEVGRRFPEITLLVHEGMSIDLAKLVESGRADLALVPSGLLPAGVDSERILDEDLVLGGQKGGEGDAPDPINFAAACRFPLVLPTRPHYIRNTVEQAAFDHGLHLNVKAEQDSARLLHRFVSAGYAYSILPENAFVEDVARGAVFTRRIVKPDFWRSMHIIWPRAMPHNRAIDGVKAALRDVVAALSRSGRLRGALKPGRE